MKVDGDILQTVIKTSVAASVAGVGYLVLKRALKLQPHGMITATYPELAAAYPSMAVDISPLLELCDKVHGEESSTAHELLRALEIVRRYDVSQTPEAASWIQRSTTAIEEMARKIVGMIPPGGSNEVFQLHMLCVEDALPQLTTHLDSILHNHLLSRRP